MTIILRHLDRFASMSPHFKFSPCFPRCHHQQAKNANLYDVDVVSDCIL
jgi:hypothetical protein